MTRATSPRILTIAAVAAAAGVLVGVNVAARDLSVPKPAEVPAVALPNDSAAVPAAPELQDRPTRAAEVLAEQFVAPVAPVAPAAPAAASAVTAAPEAPAPALAASPPTPAVRAAAKATAAASPQQSPEPPGWKRARAAGGNPPPTWAGPPAPGKAERRGWQRGS